MYRKNVILLTGLPGSGKSTIVKNAVEMLVTEGAIKKCDIFGYKTIRLFDDAGRLEGFEIVTYGGEKCTLATVNNKTADKYMGLFVNRDAFDHIIVNEFERAKRAVHPLICIDEIGLMEKISPRYTACVVDLLQNYIHPIVAVIKLIEKDDFLDRIKGLDNAVLYAVDESARACVEKEVCERLCALVKTL